jgi:hypothetical protein
MLVGVLGATSRSAGFILEHCWSFLTVLFLFAAVALAVVCLPESSTLLLFVVSDAKILFQQAFRHLFSIEGSLFFLVSCSCFHSFIVCKICNISHLGG